MNLNQKQQGDIGLERIEKIPEGAEKQRRAGDLILAKGSATGHAHRIKAKSAEIYFLGEKRFLKLSREVELMHEEHKTVELDKGIWEIALMNEHDYLTEETRQVAD